jgi:outer membrane protein insertion porin family
MLKIKVPGIMKIVAAAAIIFAMPACKVAKNLPEGQSLVTKNKFVYEKNADFKKAGGKVKDDLKAISALKPNKRVFGFLPFKMWLYYSATRPRPNEKKLGKAKNNFRVWMRDKVGEPPVIYNADAAIRSDRAMENYLFNNGFYYAQVTDTVIIKKKKAVVIYKVKSGDAWELEKVIYPPPTTLADSFVVALKARTKLKKGNRFSITDLKTERERIEIDLRSNGFYYFTREYVNFDLDTSTIPGKVNLKVKTLPPPDSTEFKQYYVDNVYIVSDYSSNRANDTTVLDTIRYKDLTIMARNHRIRKQILADAVYFSKDSLYNAQDEQRTLRRMADLGVFKYVSIDFKRSPDKPRGLDCVILLTQTKKQVVSVSGEANVSNEGFFGVAATLSYKNRNLTKRADLLSIDLGSGIQIQFPKNKEQKVEIITTDASADIAYYLNKFLLPFKPKAFSRNNNPKTRFTAHYNFQNRFDFDTLGDRTFLYQLHNFSFGFGYDWTKSLALRHIEMRHLLNPINVSFYLLPKVGDEFTRRLSLNNTLKNSFQEQIIIGPTYSFEFSDRGGLDDKTYSYFRTNLETAGNVLFGIYTAAKAKKSAAAGTPSYTMFNRVFSQFVRMDFDFRNYFVFNSHSMFAIRTFAGAGIAYGNSQAMPFVRQYFVGGPNSLRGFLIREVGPGSYADTTVFNVETGKYEGTQSTGFFNQTGDIKLELNAELRFDIFKWIKGALFADAGNVWLLRKDAARPGANFEFNRFWKEFAVDVGAGLRLDFNFFVIRLDYGFPIRDPRIAGNNKWKFDKGQFQLAIGYPF